ncbi:MAG: flagellar hook-length control protein FliK [Dethiobacteria bacterium]|jgi:hypothetical protein
MNIDVLSSTVPVPVGDVPRKLLDQGEGKDSFAGIFEGLLATSTSCTLPAGAAECEEYLQDNEEEALFGSVPVLPELLLEVMPDQNIVKGEQNIGEAAISETVLTTPETLPDLVDNPQFSQMSAGPATDGESNTLQAFPPESFFQILEGGVASQESLQGFLQGTFPLQAFGENTFPQGLLSGSFFQFSEEQTFPQESLPELPFQVFGEDPELFPRDFADDAGSRESLQGQSDGKLLGIKACKPGLDTLHNLQTAGKSLYHNNQFSVDANFSERVFGDVLFNDNTIPQEGVFQSDQDNQNVIASLKGDKGLPLSVIGDSGGTTLKPEVTSTADTLPQKVFAQIADKMELLVRSGEQELRLKLQPEFLGEILIKMRRIKGLLSAEIVTQSLALKELLEGNLENLRQRFQELNLSLEDLNISLGGKNGGGSGSGANKSPHFALPFKARDGKAEEKNIYFSGIEPEGKVNCLV